MRTVLLFLIAALPLSSGCSISIAESGQDLSRLTTREQVRAEFGTPVATGTIDGSDYEEFRTRRKVVEHSRAFGYRVGVGTFLPLELLTFPTELAIQMRRVIGGQTLRFCYDGANQVTGVHLDGDDQHLHKVSASTPTGNAANEQQPIQKQP